VYYLRTLRYIVFVHGIVGRLLSRHIGGSAIYTKSLPRGVGEGTGVHGGVQVLRFFHN
jgi:hypothetical protein